MKKKTLSLTGGHIGSTLLKFAVPLASIISVVRCLGYFIWLEKRKDNSNYGKIVSL